MKIINKLLDYSTPWEYPDIYLFTGNSTIKNNGAIVMGRGAAKQVRDNWPGADKALGKALKERPDALILWVKVYFHPGATNPMQKIGWFKVKYHWSKQAEIALIAASADKLRSIAKRSPEITFHMNYPGIGNGKLSIDSVQPLLEILPDNVLIYKGEQS
jgi:hypothetical protein